MRARVGEWIRSHPRHIDVFVVAFWVLTGLIFDVLWPEGGRSWLLLAPTLVMGGALFWRRTHPVPVFLLHATVILILTVIDVDEDVPSALLAGVYSLAAWDQQRRRSLAVLGGFLLLAIGVVSITDRNYVDDAASIALVLAVCWLLGETMQYRRRFRDSLIDRAERAEALRDSMAQQAVVEERTRIARELHDVVAHSMSLMVVQAGAARRIAPTDPDRTVELIESVEHVGRSSLDEMRRLLGVLRGEADDDPEVAPQPDLSGLEDLTAEFARAGVAVTINERGTASELPASLGLTAYRIVQESLTNTLKHANARTARVLLDWRPNELDIVIEDDGTVNAARDESGAGKGLIGMRERVAAFGGDFSADPRLGGGWRVRARLPFGDALPPQVKE